ncbi:MAG: type II toxin-antitoxin system VapC family toxin [bacterium]|nr:type II toxin-antitoxin system VapC family toxin [bacterium]
MTYLLDANTCIRHLNGTSDSVRKRMESAHPSDLALCSVVKAELFYGALKSARQKRNLKKLVHFASRFVSLPFDDPAARVYGRIRARLEKQGTLIGPNDLLIAAIALASKATLVTHNIREFSRVKGLRLEDWESDPAGR